MMSDTTRFGREERLRAGPNRRLSRLSAVDIETMFLFSCTRYRHPQSTTRLDRSERLPYKRVLAGKGKLKEKPLTR